MRPFLLGWLSLLAVSCGSSPPAVLEASDAWARPTPPTAANGVVYLTLTTDVADELVAVEIPEAVADRAELHVTTVSDAPEAGHAHGAAGGDVVRMEELETIAVPAGGAIELSPGGNHIMLIDLAAPLERGATFDLTLELESRRTVTALVTVDDNPPE